MFFDVLFFKFFKLKLIILRDVQYRLLHLFDFPID